MPATSVSPLGKPCARLRRLLVVACVPSALALSGAGAAHAAEPPPPEITAVSPDHGPWSGGTTVVITGTNFTGATAVKFARFGWEPEATSFTVDSDTEIAAVTPEGPSHGFGLAVVDIVVTGPGGISSETFSDRFSYGPTIDALVPERGPASGGTAVTLFGFGLEETSAVDFGSVPAESFTDNPDGSVTAIAPPRGTAETIVPITVTTPEGTSENYNRWQEAMPVNFFTYGPTVTRVIPDLGPEAGAGTKVTILGSGFETSVFFCLCGPFVDAVLFGDAEVKCGLPFGAASPSCSPVEFEVISDHEITATVPPGHGTVGVAVSTHGGISPPNPEAQFTYPPDRSPPDAEEPPLLLLMSCVVSKHGGSRAGGFCSSRSFTPEEESALRAGPVRVSLYRGKTLYATGSARVHRQSTHLLLKPVRPVRGGRYELVLSHPAAAGGRRWSRREVVMLH